MSGHEHKGNITIREVRSTDLERCFEIETISYSGEEAATKEKIFKRIETYPDGFVVLEQDNKVIGFINSGATHQVELSNEEFKELIGHDSDGEHIVIMSVVVHPEHQRKGFASQLMKRFTAKMKEAGKTDLYLICQTGLIDMYASHGFSYLGKSDSDHGGMSWHEMVLTL